MTEETSVAEVSIEDAKAYLDTRLSERGVAQVAEGVINPIELAKALDVRPQMLYSYIRDGRIVARKTVDTQKLVFDLDTALEFVAKRLTREAQRAAKAAA
jgi:hypothetical protein